MLKAERTPDEKTRYIFYQSNHTLSINDSHLARCEKCDVKYKRDTASGFRFCPWCGRFIDCFVDEED